MSEIQPLPQEPNGSNERKRDEIKTDPSKPDALRDGQEPFPPYEPPQESPNN